MRIFCSDVVNTVSKKLAGKTTLIISFLIKYLKTIH